MTEAIVSVRALPLGVDNVKTGLSGRESLNRVAEPGRNLMETNVFDVAKSVRAQDRGNAGWREAAGQAFIGLLQLFGPLRDEVPDLA